MKLLGDRPLCPPFPQDARRFVRVDKLSALGLRKSFGNVRGNGLAFRIIHSVLLVLVDNGKRLVKQLFQAHP